MLRLQRRALTNDPSNRASLDSLLDTARRESNWLRVGLLTRLRFEAARTPRERVGLTLEAGRIESERRHNPAGARSWLEKGLEVDPHAIALHEALADVAHGAILGRDQHVCQFHVLTFLSRDPCRRLRPARTVPR